MRIDRRLVELGHFDSRARAQSAIEAGLVRVDGNVVLKASHIVSAEARIESSKPFDWVGRGALKLLAALETWPISLAGQVVLDIGASTGGFTEVALSHGARKVYAVDVGHGQLHPKLSGDPRVVDLSGTDSRILNGQMVEEPPGCILCDVSFISLTKALGAALKLAHPGAVLIALVKPQFEAGRNAIGKGGLVKDSKVRDACLETVSGYIDQQGWSVLGAKQSPIPGGNGAIEFLLYAIKSGYSTT